MVAMISESSHVGPCRECGRRKPSNYFISESLCKKCAAKRRRPRANPVVEVTLPSGREALTGAPVAARPLLATQAVVGRLQRQAETMVPRTLRDHAASLLPPFAFATFWAIGYFSGLSPLPESFRDLSPVLMWAWLLFWISWYTAIPGAIGFFCSFRLSRPRDMRVAMQLYQLAARRAEAMSNAEQFYASPEWNAMRMAVVALSDGLCKSCRRRLRHKGDLTVDHILPRSRFPERALDPANLQVLCRRCNSRKGACHRVDA